MRSGFTLIEVLVAFTILALGLTLIQRTFADAATNASRAADRAEAQLLAQSVLSLFGHTMTAAGLYSGTDSNGRNWRLQARALERVDGPPLTVPLYAVTVDVEMSGWSGQPASYTLETIKRVEL